MDWDPSLETGHATIDGQHCTLFALFNELEHAEADGRRLVQDILDRLTDYVSMHFAMEEDLMRREGFPQADVDGHIEEHRALTQRVRTMVVDYHSGGMTSIDPLVGLLRGWLTEHVAECDRLLVGHIHRNRGD